MNAFKKRYIYVIMIAMALRVGIGYGKNFESNIVTFINQTNNPLTVEIKSEGTEKFTISNQSFKNFKTIKLSRCDDNPYIKTITLNDSKYGASSPLVRYFNAKIASCSEPLIELNDTVLGLIEELRGKEKKIATLINQSPLTLDITINKEHHFVLAPKSSCTALSRSLKKARQRAFKLTKPSNNSEDSKKDLNDSMIVTTLEEKNNNVFIESMSINNREYTKNNPVLELFNTKIALGEFITMDASLLDELDLRQSNLSSTAP